MNDPMNNYLQALVNSGVYGDDIDAVIVRLVEDGIRRAVRDGIINRQETAIDDRPRCSNCGSPNLAPGQTMGSGLECQSCGVMQ